MGGRPWSKRQKNFLSFNDLQVRAYAHISCFFSTRRSVFFFCLGVCVDLVVIISKGIPRRGSIVSILPSCFPLKSEKRVHAKSSLFVFAFGVRYLLLRVPKQ